MSALEKQIGGGHYAKLKIQPVDYIMANGLDYLQGNVIKYVTRFRDKAGVQDLDKAIHYIEMLKERHIAEIAARCQAAAEQVEWPIDDSRIDVIGSNGNDGLAYQEWRG
jgi:hypothetical protein